MKKFISDLILQKLGHIPTGGQKEMIDKLAAFVSSPEANSLFLLKGYAGTGKTSAISALVKVLDELKIKSFQNRVVNLPQPFIKKSTDNSLRQMPRANFRWTGTLPGILFS